MTRIGAGGCGMDAGARPALRNGEPIGIAAGMGADGIRIGATADPFADACRLPRN